MLKVRIRVPFTTEIYYILDVDDPKDTEGVVEQLKETDPSNWEYDPNFYELLGMNFRDYCTEVREDQIETI